MKSFWNILNNSSQLDSIITQSDMQPVLLFKHSTRCSISSTALNRLENKWAESTSKIILPYYVDLLQFRDVSNEIANRFGITHESPQALIISKGKVIYAASHLEINLADMLEKLNQ